MIIILAVHCLIYLIQLILCYVLFPKLSGWVGSLGIGVSCLSSPIANPLIERFGNRVVIVAGILLSFSSMMLTSFMPILEVMYLTYSVLYGLGAGLQLMSSINLALQYFPTRNSTRSVCIIMAGANIGKWCVV